MFKFKKRCPFCGHELGEDKQCHNDNCGIGKALKEKKEKEEKDEHDN